MKSLFLFIPLALGALASCQNFLDETPDNRTRVDSEDKVAKLLVYAYVNAQYGPFAETMSDNVMEGGYSSGKNSLYTQINESAYWWKDYESVTGPDTPSNFWTESYKAIAQANLALESLEKLGSQTSRASALRGEALIARAYAHFMLVNLFSMRYDPATASTALGVPYVLSSEKNAFAHYHRETMAETYRLIEKDLTEGLPLIGKDYEKPKFHFSPQSANAFAARFYLYKGEWDKVVAHASLALGNASPASVIRDLTAGIYSRNAAPDEYKAQYSSTTERANLLIGWTNSAMAKGVADCYYGYTARMEEMLFAYGRASIFVYKDNPNQNKLWLYQRFVEGNSTVMPRYMEYLRILDPITGKGQPYASFIHFTTDEALLNRAEAYAMLNRWEDASRDLTAFLSLKITDFDAAEDIATLELMKKHFPKPKNEEEAYAPPYALSVEQAAFVEGIAEFRRREFYYEGLRWLDTKRFNLIVERLDYALPIGIKLPRDDPRRAIQIPEAAKAFGIEVNPR